MEILYVIIAMVVVGLIIGFIAGLIWKDERNNYPVAIIAAVITGLLDFYVIPMMGFSDTLSGSASHSNRLWWHWVCFG